MLNKGQVFLTAQIVLVKHADFTIITIRINFLINPTWCILKAEIVRYNYKT